MQLSDEERERIRLEETYRAEVREKLAEAPAKQGDSWVDKLVVPLVIVLISGLLAPWVLMRIEDHRRALELQSRLIEQLVADDAEAQINLLKRTSFSFDKGINPLRLALHKRLLTMAPVDAAERQQQRTEFYDDFSRQQARVDAGSDAVKEAMFRFQVEHRGNVEWVKLHYGNAPKLQAYANATKRAWDAAVAQTETFEQQVDGIARKTTGALHTCPDPPSCLRLFNDAVAEADKLRQRSVDIKGWDSTRRQLIRYISETDPRM